MSLLSTGLGAVTTAAAPYMLWIRIAFWGLVIAAVVGVGWYVKSVFNERLELTRKLAASEYALGREIQDKEEARRQIIVWQKMAEDINKAVRVVRVQSDTYIQGVEDAKLPEYDDGTIVPFVLPASTAAASLPRFENVSTGRKRTTAS